MSAFDGIPGLAAAMNAHGGNTAKDCQFCTMPVVDGKEVCEVCKKSYSVPPLRHQTLDRENQAIMNEGSEMNWIQDQMRDDQIKRLDAAELVQDSTWVPSDDDLDDLDSLPDPEDLLSDVGSNPPSSGRAPRRRSGPKDPQYKDEAMRQYNALVLQSEQQALADVPKEVRAPIEGPREMIAGLKRKFVTFDADPLIVNKVRLIESSYNALPVANGGKEACADELKTLQLRSGGNPGSWRHVASCDNGCIGRGKKCDGGYKWDGPPFKDATRLKYIWDKAGFQTRADLFEQNAAQRAWDACITLGTAEAKRSKDWNEPRKSRKTLITHRSQNMYRGFEAFHEVAMSPELLAASGQLLRAPALP